MKLTFFCAYLLRLSNIGQTIHLDRLLLSNGRDAQSTSERRMAEEEVEKIIHHTKRIFINNVDSYASKCIAKVGLSETNICLNKNEAATRN